MTSNDTPVMRITGTDIDGILRRWKGRVPGAASDFVPDPDSPCGWRITVTAPIAPSDLTKGTTS